MDPAKQYVGLDNAVILNELMERRNRDFVSAATRTLADHVEIEWFRDGSIQFSNLPHVSCSAFNKVLALYSKRASYLFMSDDRLAIRCQNLSEDDVTQSRLVQVSDLPKTKYVEIHRDTDVGNRTTRVVTLKCTDGKPVDHATIYGLLQDPQCLDILLESPNTIIVQYIVVTGIKQGLAESLRSVDTAEPPRLNARTISRIMKSISVKAKRDRTKRRRRLRNL